MNKRCTHSEMQAAEAEFHEATRAALHSGAMATQPLTVIRINQLCALGERMIRAERAMKAMQVRG